LDLIRKESDRACYYLLRLVSKSWVYGQSAGNQNVPLSHKCYLVK
jgi:hypothetical protein